MILGILSDTHGQAARTADAVHVLEQAGAEAFIHCGDIGAPAVLDELAGRRAWLVLGNTDAPDSLTAYAAALGLALAPQTPLRLRFDGRKLAVFHGHEAPLAHLLDRLALGAPPPRWAADCDYVLHGHTHEPADSRVSRPRIINPGALHRADSHTVATLDLRCDAVRFWHVGRDPGAEPPTETRPTAVW